MDAASSDEECALRLCDALLGYCADLVGEGKTSFKLSECKERFMTVPDKMLTLACTLLCKQGQLQLDPASRRILVYTLDKSLVETVGARLQGQREAAADVAAIAVQEKKEQEKKDSAQEKAQEKKAIAIAATAAAVKASAGEAKKAKRPRVEARKVGTASIASYFKPAPSAPSAPFSIPSSAPPSSAPSSSSSAPSA
eukprot:CAMPEP_0173306904 /NCGR_PEP_ID=MMETSP1143-20121109/20844_1 /TAXON_ID=483371 /ORGANISM="non described non described, Strain CCMP2298" /LENGTH=196 /DNA_ID=CAMNT_0014248057 /DNA_START=104 /DNA_END=691 /DNA_ORIENTATION=+